MRIKAEYTRLFGCEMMWKDKLGIEKRTFPHKYE